MLTWEEKGSSSPLYSAHTHSHSVFCTLLLLVFILFPSLDSSKFDSLSLVFCLLEAMKNWRRKRKGGSILYPILQHPWPSDDMQRIRAVGGYGSQTWLKGKAGLPTTGEGKKKFACRTLGAEVSGVPLAEQSRRETYMPVNEKSFKARKPAACGILASMPARKPCPRERNVSRISFTRGL